MFEPLPALIRLQRQTLGLTVDALSVLAGVSRTRLIALENGSDNISLELLVKITNALGMTELKIGGLRVTASTPDYNLVVAAAEAIMAARKIVEQARAGGDELDRVSAPVWDLLAPVIKAPAEPVVAPRGRAKDTGRRAAGRRQ